MKTIKALELPERKRNKFNSRWVEMYPKARFLELMGTDYMTTGQVTELIGCSGDLTYMRLNQLTKEGKIIRTRAKNIWLWKRV